MLNPNPYPDTVFVMCLC